MSNNDKTNKLIKWIVIVLDFAILNLLITIFAFHHSTIIGWSVDKQNIFILSCNLAMVVSEYFFYTVIHRRLITSSDILKRLSSLIMLFIVISYLILKALYKNFHVGIVLLEIGSLLFVLLLIARIIERYSVKRYRMSGGNYRKVVFVGSDTELLNIYEKLHKDPTRGFRILGYYGNGEIKGNDGRINKLGTLDEFLENVNNPECLTIGDDIYVSISRLQAETIKQISRLCEKTVTRFYYVPISVETIGLPLKREFVDDIEVFATYENPLVNPVNKTIKRVFDIIFSAGALLCILPFIPIIALIIKIQSPKGGVFFKQPRTGLDGKMFYCYKFRSMHPNKDESGLVQAKKDDPRKFPFGNFMRKTSIDELPQFWNVFKGDMSVVGPRPHPVALNEEYVKLIDKYMVRHFVKPGVTGWAQVTGFRGETEELWQMEGRIKRDIWYMENWSFWLDLRILWLTGKQMAGKDEKAY